MVERGNVPCRYDECASLTRLTGGICRALSVALNARLMPGGPGAENSFAELQRSRSSKHLAAAITYLYCAAADVLFVGMTAWDRTLEGRSDVPLNTSSPCLKITISIVC